MRKTLKIKQIPCNSTSQARTRGRNFALDVMADLDETFLHTAVEDLQEQPFGVQEVVPLLPALSPLTMEVITFLEDAEYLLADIPPDEGTGVVQDSLDQEEQDLLQAVQESREQAHLSEPHAPSSTQYGGSSASTAAMATSGTMPSTTTTGTTGSAAPMDGISTTSSSAASVTRPAGTGPLTEGTAGSCPIFPAMEGTKPSPKPLPTPTPFGGANPARTTSSGFRRGTTNVDQEGSPCSSTTATTGGETTGTMTTSGEVSDNTKGETIVHHEISTSPKTSPKRRRKLPVPDHERIKRFMEGTSRKPSTDREG